MKWRILLKIVPFILSVSIIGCSKKPEMVYVNQIQKEMEYSTEKVYRILQDGSLSKAQKMEKLEIIVKTIDSLSISWDENIEKIRGNLSEEQLEKIEDDSRKIYEDLRKVVLREMPEYSELFQ